MNTSLSPQPYRFSPLFRPYIWGGRALETTLKKQIPDTGIWAESWEIVDHGKDQSVVSEGTLRGKSLRQLIESDPKMILGPDANENDQFPLLLKYLDCQRVLSVQVHPDDLYGATMNPPDLGKTEAWYVVEASQDALIYAGLKEGVTKESLLEAIEKGDIENCLYSFHPEQGDCVFIPAGTVHALGAGLIVAEIQQASDTTFRLFDWNRLGDNGLPRPLHIQQAMEVIDFERGPVKPSSPKPTTDSGRVNLVTCDRFILDEVRASIPNISLKGQFAIATVVRGNASIKSTSESNSILTSAHAESHDLPHNLTVGQSVLLPAAMEFISIDVEPNSVLLLARPPQ